MNSPAIPDSCPKCNSPVKGGWDNLFTCGTAYYEEGPLSGKVEERPWCWKLQRDQLAERVKELEAKLADRDEAAACAVIQDERRGES